MDAMSYSSIESVEDLSTYDPEFAKVSESIPNPEAKATIDPTSWRQGLAQLSTARFTLSAQDLDVDETTTCIPMRDTHQSPAKIYRPTPARQTTPLVVLVHGGGFVVGDNQMYKAEARAIASVFGAVVVNISYRLAPEHKFPHAANDVWDSVRWLGENAASLGADASAGFVLGGESAGGNLAAVTALQGVREKLSPPLTGVLLSIPYLCVDGDAVPASRRHLWVSREQNRNAPFLDTESIDLVTSIYEPDACSPLFSPFAEENADALAEMPRTFFQICGLDPVRDDGLVCERVLRELGVETKLQVYPGVPHAIWHAIPTMEVSKKAVREFVEGVGWLLRMPSPEDQVKKALHLLV